RQHTFPNKAARHLRKQLAVFLRRRLKMQDLGNHRLFDTVQQTKILLGSFPIQAFRGGEFKARIIVAVHLCVFRQLVELRFADPETCEEAFRSPYSEGRKIPLNLWILKSLADGGEIWNMRLVRA